MTDQEYMTEALELAERGRRETHPNPMVGAVVVRAGKVVGRGHHRGPGAPHAEVVALREAGDKARGATLFASLEPCCTQGRTPPCTQAIIGAGLARVLCAMLDPNPAVNGGGVSALRGAGVEVAGMDGDLHTRALALNAPFTRFMRTGLPLITFKAAVSLDGKVAAAGGDAHWISSAESRRRVHQMRAAADAVMVGAGTLRRDDPELTVRDAPGRDAVRVVVSRTGELPLAAKALSGAGPATIVLTERMPAAIEAALRERGVECLVTGPEGLSRGLAALATRGLLDILLEGGPGLAGSLLAAGLIDRVAFFVAPLIVGRGAPDLFAAPASRSLVDAWRLEDVQWSTSGPDALVTGRITAPPPLAQKEG